MNILIEALFWTMFLNVLMAIAFCFTNTSRWVVRKFDSHWFGAFLQIYGLLGGVFSLLIILASFIEKDLMTGVEVYHMSFGALFFFIPFILGREIQAGKKYFFE